MPTSVTIHGPSTGSAVIADGGVATADLAAGAVTGAKLATAAIKVVSFDGRSGAGACTATGLAVGDRVIAVVGIAGELGGVAAKFESTITVVNQIQQSDAGDLSSNDYLVIAAIPAA